MWKLSSLKQIKISKEVKAVVIIFSKNFSCFFGCFAYFQSISFELIYALSRMKNEKKFLELPGKHLSFILEASGLQKYRLLTLILTPLPYRRHIYCRMSGHQSHSEGLIPEYKRTWDHWTCCSQPTNKCNHVDIGVFSLKGWSSE